MQKEVIFSQRKWKIHFSSRRWTNKIFWKRSGTENIHLDTGPRPIRGESHENFLGELEGSLPPPHDWFPDAGEAMNDFWSMSGNFIYRHQVEPRVKLYSPREESFPNPLKYIDVSRTTHTNLDVMPERRIDDYWNIDGSRDLSDSWTGFTQFTLWKEKPPDGYMWSGERLTRKQADIQARSFMARTLDEIGKKCLSWRTGNSGHIEKPKLDNARKLRGIYFTDPDDNEFKETIRESSQENWKRRWLLLCLAKQARTVKHGATSW